MIYLDSAATTFQKPPAVGRAMTEALASMSSPGRGGHPLAMRAADTAFRCRTELAELFGLDGPEGVAFTLNATHALNIAIKSLVPPGGRVVISGYEHNAVTRPLTALKAKVSVAGGPLFDQEAAIRAFDELIAPGVDVVICNHVSNVFGFVQPVEKVAALCRSRGVPLIVDNTFATPFLFRPLEHGADVVVHSATKFIGGHGTVMGGVVVDGGKFDWAASDKFPGLSKPNPSYHGVVFTEACGNIAYIMKLRTTLMRDTGATLSPFHSFLLLQGLETLSLRVERHVENALKVVDYLKNHPMVKKVNHPSQATGKDLELYNKYYPNGGASIFTFELNGTKEQAQKFTESLKIFSLLANVADVKSLVIHPASTTHSQMTEEELLAAGITPTTVRLSIGIEHIDDILADLEQGFEAVK